MSYKHLFITHLETAIFICITVIVTKGLCFASHMSRESMRMWKTTLRAIFELRFRFKVGVIFRFGLSFSLDPRLTSLLMTD